MDMNKLHYFCTVVMTGSLAKASEILHISQPAISKAIKALEYELDKKLIIASGRGIVISDEGQLLAKSAKPLIDQAFNLKNIFNQEHDEARPLTIGTFEVFSSYFLGSLIANEFNERKTEVLELLPGKLERAIAKGDVDIGITYVPIPNPEVDILKVATVEMGVFGLKGQFSNKPFNQIPFVVPMDKVESTPSKVQGLDGWPDSQVPRNIVHKVAMMETALELCRNGICVGYFPKFVIELHNEKVLSKYKLVEVTKKIALKYSKQDVYMIKRKTDLETRDFKILSRALRQSI